MPGANNLKINNNLEYSYTDAVRLNFLLTKHKGSVPDKHHLLGLIEQIVHAPLTGV